MDKISLFLRDPFYSFSYLLSKSNDHRTVLSLSFLTENAPSTVAATMVEAKDVVQDLNTRFQKEVEDKGAWPMNEFELAALYVLTRTVKPNVVLETGVGHGASSATILAALAQNGKGSLHSIDLPNATYNVATEEANVGWVAGSTVKDSIVGKETGWLVSEDLKSRWSLVLGSTNEKLEPVLEELGHLDIFIHDSEHTYKNMMYEYTAAWRYLGKSGWLVSDDVNWNEAFKDFARQSYSKARIVERFGTMRKVKEF